MPTWSPIEPRILVREAIQRLGLKAEGSPSSWSDDVKIHCPYHRDRHPSLNVNQHGGQYQCWSCKRAGTIAGLYFDLTQRSLYADLGVSMDDFSLTGYELQYAEPVIDYDALPMKVVMESRANPMPYKQSPLAVNYLRRRGIPFEIADKMGAFFLAKGWYRGDPEKDFSFFSNRLMFPIYEQGVLLSIEARDTTGLSAKKVLYPRGTSVATLYDLENLDTKKPLYVTEGLMGLAVLRSDPFFANSTSLFGSSLSHRQIHLLKRFDKIILIPDADKAGTLMVHKLGKAFLGIKAFWIMEVPRGRGIADIGDIVQKAHSSVAAERARGWGAHEVSIYTAGWMPKAFDHTKDNKKESLKEINDYEDD